LCGWSWLPSLPPRHGDLEMAIGVDGELIPRRQHGGRGMLLDESRPFDAVAGKERAARIGGGVDEAGAFVVDRPLAGEGLLDGRGAARLDRLLRGLPHDATHRGAQADDLGAFLGRTSAIALLVLRIEMPLDRRAVLQ